MRSTPVGKPAPRRRRGRASIATLVALFAFFGGTQALTAPAVAMDDVFDGSGCDPRVGLPDGWGMNAFGELCTYEIGGGGSGPLGYGGGGGSVAPAPAPVPAPTPWQPGQVYRPEAEAPHHCIVWPEHCRQSRNNRDSTGPLRQQADEKGRGRHETPRGNPVQGKGQKPVPAGDPKKCKALPHINEPANAVVKLERRMHWLERSIGRAEQDLDLNIGTEKGEEISQDIALYRREIADLKKRSEAILESRRQWYLLRCQGGEPWLTDQQR
jgi:hypothetical protein